MSRSKQAVSFSLWGSRSVYAVGAVLKQGELDEAERLIQRALALNPGCAPAVRNLEYLQELRQAT